MKMAGWLMIGTFIAGVLVCLGSSTGSTALWLLAVGVFSPLIDAFDQQSGYNDEDDDEDDDDDGPGNILPESPEPWWPSGVCMPEDELIGV